MGQQLVRQFLILKTLEINECKYTKAQFDVIFSAARCGVMIDESWLEGEMLVLAEKLAEENVIFSRPIEANLDCDKIAQGTKTKDEK